ncbi:MAG: hypothetical protein JNL41_10875 [Phenylobacterium sp.]|uniref:terminase small subunit-like protein n=1 Tax=Phenylobacterium sp. TaxID=1871053 RepID=UPI001A51D9A3|nr:hypothetical protein [Phenylobacterium sp.]MBL8554772.1 hypothetical protein [Phenylobacterium sp.]
MARKAKGGGADAPPAVQPRRRNTRYSQAMVDKLCGLRNEGQTWEAICGREDTPAYSTVCLWRNTKPEFVAALRAADAGAADLRADEALEFARNAAQGPTGDRLRHAAFMQRAALDAPQRWDAKTVAAAFGAGAGKAPRVEVVFRVRRFEKAVNDEGRTVLREIFPEGESGSEG